MKTDKATIERFRIALPSIRNVLGWSAERLAILIGITRVTMVNIENTKDKMTTMQYLAIRALLQEEIYENNNVILKNVLTILVDDENISERVKQELINQIASSAKSVPRKCGSDKIGEKVQTTLGEMHLDEFSPETIAKGKSFVEALLQKPVNTKSKEE